MRWFLCLFPSWHILQNLKRLERVMTKGLDDIKASEDAIKAAVADAVQKITDLSGQIASADSQTDLEAVAADMKSVADGLEAVVNPPAPEPDPTPAV